MSIDKEDIARLRYIAEDGIIRGVNKNWQGSEVLRLLDALEAAEARAEAAERERDALADVLESTGGEFACCIGCPFPKKREIVCRDQQDDLPEKQCWLEWARQQARGGENV